MHFRTLKNKYKRSYKVSLVFRSSRSNVPILLYKKDQYTNQNWLHYILKIMVLVKFADRRLRIPRWELRLDRFGESTAQSANSMSGVKLWIQVNNSQKAICKAICNFNVTNSGR